MKTYLFILSLILLSSCVTLDKPLEPGRCDINTDCIEGFRCVNTYCKDIHYPKESMRLP